MDSIVYNPYISRKETTLPTQSFDFDTSPILRSAKKQPVIVNPLPETKQEVTVADLPSVSQIVRGTTTFKIPGTNVGNMQSVLDKFNEHGISLRVTSGLRPGALTSSGKSSHHSFGNAIDITPGEGETGDTLRAKLKGAPVLIKGLQDNGYGILDETNSDTLTKTGGTGAHWHIGPDDSAKRGLLALIAKHGGILKAQYGTSTNFIEQMPEGEDTIPEPYQKQFDISYNPFKKNVKQLQGSDEHAFQKGYAAVAQLNNLSKNPDDPEHHYDWRGYFKEHNNAVELPEGHFPDTYKLPGHDTFSVESKYYKPGMMAGHGKENNFVPTPFSEDEMEARQHGAETRFKSNRTSGASAKGAFQIMPETGNEIVRRNNLNVDINNYNDNKKVRDIYLKNLSKYSSIAKAPEPIKTALKYAAYNMGPGNLEKFIKKEQDKGIDVYKSWDGIDDLNSQTRDYVNFIVRGIDGSADLTEADFKKALPNRFK